MRGSLFLLWFICLTTRIWAQSPTYTGAIQPILIQHCAPCHQPGGVGPFSLLTYEDVSKRGKFVAKVTQSRYMPPFPADRQFQHYANERGLSEAEIKTIQQWVSSGMPKGEVRQTKTERNSPKPLVEARKPDLVLRMEAYAIKGDGREDFRYFHVPMNRK